MSFYVNSTNSSRSEIAVDDNGNKTEIEFDEVTAGIADWQNTDIASKWFATEKEANAYIDTFAAQLCSEGYSVKTKPGELYARKNYGDKKVK